MCNLKIFGEKKCEGVYTGKSPLQSLPNKLSLCVESKSRKMRKEEGDLLMFWVLSTLSPRTETHTVSGNTNRPLRTPGVGLCINFYVVYFTYSNVSFGQYNFV